jgi:hypothetical protein
MSPSAIVQLVLGAGKGIAELALWIRSKRRRRRAMDKLRAEAARCRRQRRE